MNIIFFRYMKFNYFFFGDRQLWFGGVEVMGTERYLLNLFEFDSSSNLK